MGGPVSPADGDFQVESSTALRFGRARCRVQLIHPPEQRQAGYMSCRQHEGLGGRTRVIKSIWLLPCVVAPTIAHIGVMENY